MIRHLFHPCKVTYESHTNEDNQVFTRPVPVQLQGKQPPSMHFFLWQNCIKKMPASILATKLHAAPDTAQTDFNRMSIP